MKKKIAIIISVVFVFLLVLVFWMVRNERNNVVELPKEPFFLEEGELPEQYSPIGYGSEVMNQVSEEELKEKYGITAIYDSTNSIHEQKVYSEEVYMYAKAVGTFMTDDLQGVDLKKGDCIVFSFESSSSANEGLSVGFVKEGLISVPEQCEIEETGEKIQYQKTIQIEEDGLYYPYIANVSDVSEYITNFNIVFDMYEKIG